MAKGRTRSISSIVTDAIIDFWHNRCGLCGSPEIERNHIELFSKGGSSENPANFILLCPNHHSLYHKKTPLGGNYLTIEDIRDLQKNNNPQKIKMNKLLLLNQKVKYNLSLGGAYFKNVEQVVSFDDRSIIELYFTAPGSRSKQKDSFFSFRFFNREGEWIGSILRNQWCGVFDTEVVLEIIEIGKWIKISLPKEDSFVEIKIESENIIIKGHFWYKDRRVIFEDRKFIFGNEIDLSSVVIEDSKTGLVLLPNGILKFGPGMFLSPGSKLQGGNFQMVQNPNGTWSIKVPTISMENQDKLKIWNRWTSERWKM